MINVNLIDEKVKIFSIGCEIKVHKSLTTNSMYYKIIKNGVAVFLRFSDHESWKYNTKSFNYDSKKATIKSLEGYIKNKIKKLSWRVLDKCCIDGKFS